MFYLKILRWSQNNTDNWLILIGTKKNFLKVGVQQNIDL